MKSTIERCYLLSIQQEKYSKKGGGSTIRPSSLLTNSLSSQSTLTSQPKHTKSGPHNQSILSPFQSPIPKSSHQHKFLTQICQKWEHNQSILPPSTPPLKQGMEWARARHRPRRPPRPRRSPRPSSHAPPEQPRAWLQLLQRLQERRPEKHYQLVCYCTPHKSTAYYSTRCFSIYLHTMKRKAYLTITNPIF